MSNKITKDEAIKKFYNTFQIGVEIEGSFLMDEDDLNDEIGDFVEIVDDGSVESCAEGGEEKEIRSPIIRSEEDERRMMDCLDRISSDYNGDRIFAYRNKTAGTHIHIDLKNQVNEFTSRTLIAFDSLEFERFFFREYFKTFNKSKFADRLRNRYCRPFLQDVQNEDRLHSTLARVEEIKGGRDRYYWINTECLLSGKGIELRIFPYLQTTNGVQEVINFTKRVMFTYWQKPKVQRRAKMIEQYYKVLASRNINMRKLNEYEKILMNALSINGRSPLKQSSDSIEFLMDLYKRKPSAFEEQNVVF